MPNQHPPSIVYGRLLGIAALVAAQVFVGIIHVVFGIWLLSSPGAKPFGATDWFSAVLVYSLYTVIFGALAILFLAGLWFGKLWGWVGTVAVLIFVVVADLLTLFDLPSVPGIPKFAGYGEIAYSVIVLAYLLRSHVRDKFGIRLP